MTNTATITLTNAHGLHTASVAVLNRAMIATANRSDDLLRRQAAGHCGFAEADWDLAYADCSRIEVLIAWIDSGNHTF
jgi:hypothetical protein